MMVKVDLIISYNVRLGEGFWKGMWVLFFTISINSNLCWANASPDLLDAFIHYFSVWHVRTDPSFT